MYNCIMEVLKGGEGSNMITEQLIIKPGKLRPKQAEALEYAIKQIKKSEFATFVSDVILFGSCARGTAKYLSDVDLLLELKPEVKNMASFSVKIHALKGSISDPNYNTVDTDLKVVTGNEWRNGRSVFFRNVSKEGVSVWN